jgi:hypothetical protein
MAQKRLRFLARFCRILHQACRQQAPLPPP